MGYDLHIIRSDDWTNAAANPIGFDEWLRFAQSNDHLAQAGTLSLGEGDVPRQPVFALPDGPSMHWWRGELVVSGADENHVSALVTIANALTARVQGDDGEFYE